MKTTKKPKLLVVHPFREAACDFYSKFQKFDVTYLSVEENTVFPKFLYFSKFPNLSPVLVKNLENFVKQNDVILISDNYYFFNLQAVYLAKKYGKKVVTILWATIPHHISSWLFPFSFISRQVVAGSDLFILRNKSAVGFALSLGVPKEKIKIIYPGVDLKKFRPTIKKESNDINILFVGKTIKSKGYHDLTTVIKKIKKEGYRINLLTAGGKNFMTYQNLPKFYGRGDIFVAPSREIKFFGFKVWEEYFSYALIEAQTVGLAIITTDNIGTREEVDSRNEFVCPGDRKGLYKSLKKLITDKNLRIKLGKINRHHAEKYFDDKVQVEKTEQAILYVKK